jgi:hypothetical protein
VLLMPFAPYFILGAALGMVRSRRELVALSPLVLTALALSAWTAESRGAFATWTSTTCVLIGLALIVVGLLVPGSRSRVSRTATALGLASFPLYLLNLRFGGLVVGALESRGVGVSLAVTVGAVLLVCLAVLWATTIEPRLQRRLKAAMQAGIAELRQSRDVEGGAPTLAVTSAQTPEADGDGYPRRAVAALRDPYDEPPEQWPAPTAERPIPGALTHEPETRSLHRRVPHPGPRPVSSHQRLPSRTPVDARDNM